MDKKLEQMNLTLKAAVQKRLFPGAVMLIGKKGETLLHEAYGDAQWLPETLPMTKDTVFDLASLTKVTATWPCIVRLLQSGALRLDMTLEEMLPRKMRDELKPITLLQLLTHTSGMTEDRDLDGFGATRTERINGALTFPLEFPIGAGVHYSDMGFALLGEIAAEKYQLPLEEAAGRIWRELGMNDTCFNPPKTAYCAATEIVNGVTTRGIVHDERAQQLFGVAGHAGAFSTAKDLGKYCAALLPGSGERLCDDEWLRRSFTLYVPDPKWDRGLAWVIYRVQEGGNLVGHTGFTGTSLWIDTKSGVYCVLLTNRVHPTRENGNLGPVRTELMNLLFGV